MGAKPRGRSGADGGIELGEGPSESSASSVGPRASVPVERFVVGRGGWMECGTGPCADRGPTALGG